MADRPGSRAAWARGNLYEYLTRVERRLFAWEWLRRTEEYQRAWERSSALDAPQRRAIARRFGLVELLPPELTAEATRPVWSARVDPAVVPTRPVEHVAAINDRLDVRFLQRWAHVVIDEDVEHWRFGDASFSIRLDVHGGTLLGGPTALSFQLEGLAFALPKVSAIRDLVQLGLTGSPPRPRPVARVPRWILELRVADALQTGASQQQIAKILLGPAVERDGWRRESESHRLRVQRLARSVRERLTTPLAPSWFQHP
jgi:hypothetical protein